SGPATTLGASLSDAAGRALPCDVLARCSDIFAVRCRPKPKECLILLVGGDAYRTRDLQSAICGCLFFLGRPVMPQQPVRQGLSCPHCRSRALSSNIGYQRASPEKSPQTWASSGGTLPVTTTFALRGHLFLGGTRSRNRHRLRRREHASGTIM